MAFISSFLNFSIPESVVPSVLETLQTQVRRLQGEVQELRQKPFSFSGKNISLFNGKLNLSPSGAAQIDARIALTPDNAPISPEILLRRARLRLDTHYDQTVRTQLHLSFDEGKFGLQNYFIDVSLWKSFARLQAGKFKNPFGLERGVQLEHLILERSLANNLAPNRDVGGMVYGDLGFFTYALGGFNGAPDGGSIDSDSDRNKEFAGRITFNPWASLTSKTLIFGFAATYGGKEGKKDNSQLASYQTPLQQTFFKYKEGVFANGLYYRLSPQVVLEWGALLAYGEYIRTTQTIQAGEAAPSGKGIQPQVTEVHHQAWEVTAAVNLTGERSSLRETVTPKSKYGAYQLAFRYSELEVDPAVFTGFADSNSSSQAIRELSLGLNAYLFDSAIKVSPTYSFFQTWKFREEEAQNNHAINLRLEGRF